MKIFFYPLFSRQIFAASEISQYATIPRFYWYLCLNRTFSVSSFGCMYLRRYSITTVKLRFKYLYFISHTSLYCYLITPQNLLTCTMCFSIKYTCFKVIYLFICSSANLSNDYFTNRQDRCIVFEDGKELCDFFHNLVKTVGSFSLQLQPDCTTKVSQNCPEHPYNGDKEKYFKIVKEQLKDFIKKYSQFRRLDYIISEMSCNGKGDLTGDDIPKKFAADNGSKTDLLDLSRIASVDRDIEAGLDTFVIPTLQMFCYDIRQDEIFTSRFLKSAPSNSDVFLATAYFNVTEQHWNEVLTSKSRNFDVVMAHPLANGFYKAPGPAGMYLPIIQSATNELLLSQISDRYITEYLINVSV